MNKAQLFAVKLDSRLRGNDSREFIALHSLIAQAQTGAEICATGSGTFSAARWFTVIICELAFKLPGIAQIERELGRQRR